MPEVTCPFDPQDRFGRSALVIAAEHQQIPVMQLLMTAGCDVDTADLQRRTALHHVALHDTDVGGLLEAGADPDAVDYLNETPLHRRSVVCVCATSGILNTSHNI